MPLSHAGKDKGTHRDMTVKFLQLANFKTISSWLINSHRSSHSRNVTLRPTFSPDHNQVLTNFITGPSGVQLGTDL